MGNSKKGPLNHEVPNNVGEGRWRGACALALIRHPNATYPQPQDVKDAEVVLLAQETDDHLANMIRRMREELQNNRPVLAYTWLHLIEAHLQKSGYIDV